MKHKTALYLVLAALLAACGLLGCVERTITIKSTPPGALVWLNGEEVGQTPVSTNFIWYGDYEVTLRKPGCQTLKTSKKASEPWFQLPVVDFFTECLIPINFKDQQNWDFTLEPQTTPDPAELIDRAEKLRSDALTNP